MTKLTRYVIFSYVSRFASVLHDASAGSQAKIGCIVALRH